MAGKLQFTLAWGFCRLGRAALQPIFEFTECKRAMGHRAITAGLRGALEFLVHLLPNLPEYDFEVLPGPEQRPALVWTDGASEELAPRPHTIGFVVATPKEGGPPLTEGRPGAEVLAQHYDLVHGSAEVPADVIAQLRSRKQQIAAVELF